MSQVFSVACYRFRATFGRRGVGYLTIVLVDFVNETLQAASVRSDRPGARRLDPLGIG